MTHTDWQIEWNPILNTYDIRADGIPIAAVVDEDKAKLFAAATELLEACKWARSVYENLGAKGETWVKPFLDGVQIVIAKVEGQS